jgi:hypothetical protein
MSVHERTLNLSKDFSASMELIMWFLSLILFYGKFLCLCSSKRLDCNSLFVSLSVPDCLCLSLFCVLVWF